MVTDLTTVRSVGSILPPDLLGRVAAGDKDLAGLSPSAYHLGGGESPREAANRAWSYLTGVWATFRAELAKRPEGDPAIGLTREKWLLILFRELGYGRLATTPAGGLTVDDRSFPVSHLWGQVPIHLLGWGIDNLDKRHKGVPGAAERAPHAMVQELLNREDDYLYAIVSNGQVLRLLRDSTNLSGQAYVEFDLAAMFDGDVFSDFALMFYVLHESRVEVRTADGPPSDCWLETWRTESIASGTRALNLLRDGVQEAIEALGTGFLQHPANAQLRSLLEQKEVRLEDLHHALLRLIYRLLFLFVAEDRQALLDPDAEPAIRQRYLDYFSTARLRRLARRRRGTKHTDLWAALTLVMRALGDEQGQPALGLPGIGGLYDPHEVDALIMDGALSNDALLGAVRSLSIVQPKGQPRRTVDFRNLGAEELGSIYESLLELVPRHNSAEHKFTLEALAGNDRKTTGSYYTPTSLIDLVLDETLDPLLDEAELADDPEAALLAMTVCDPACGSGHFLVAAARRIAERLAMVRTGETDLTPTDVQEAMHDVVERCIYGVDLQPLAAELAKVSLWLEAMTPGRPLSFLDSHIKVGNALLGTTPALIAEGIPDEAFVALTGDSKPIVTALKKQNKNEREAGQDSLFDVAEAVVSNDELRDALEHTQISGPSNLGQLHEAKRRYAAYLASPALARERLRADAWCAAFVQPKTETAVPITTSTLQKIDEDSLAGSAAIDAIRARAAEFRFFHWWIEFPEIFDVSASTTTQPNGWTGGFTAMVGNPPWETVQMTEKEFFASRSAEIAEAKNANIRKKLIAELAETEPGLHAEFVSASRRAGAETTLIRGGRYPLTARGKINTYAIFVELSRSSISPTGRVGIIVPTGIVTDASTQLFFQDVIRQSSLYSVRDFRNNGFFEGVASAQGFRFCLLVLCGSPWAHPASITFRATSVNEALRSDRTVYLTSREIAKLNPNTGTCPGFLSRRDAEMTLDIYSRFPILVDRVNGDNPWGITFRQGLFNMSSDSGKFMTAHELSELGANFDGWSFTLGESSWQPLYEAKMVHYYNHRHGDFRGVTIAPGKDVRAIPRPPIQSLKDPHFENIGRYWVSEQQTRHVLQNRWEHEWLLGWRDVATSLDARTCIPCVIPKSAVGGGFHLAFPHTRPRDSHVLIAVWSSFVFDFVVRQKTSGSHINFTIFEQLACPPPTSFDQPMPGVVEHGSFGSWILPRVLELTYTSWRIAAFANNLLGLAPGADPGPPFYWNPERRELLRAELDASMFQLFGLNRDEVEHVMESFPRVRKHDERDHGEFRTKRLILEIYDAMADAAARGTTYESKLDPPAGHGPRHTTEGAADRA